MKHFSTIQKHTLLLAVFAFCLHSASAQQLPIFTQYREYQGYINPASVTSEFMLYEQRGSAGLSYHKQWAGHSNSPETQMARADYLWTPNQRQVSLLGGGYVINDQAGALGQTGAYFRLGGVVSDDPFRGGVSLGLSFGFSQFSLDLGDLRMDAPEPISLPRIEENKVKLDVGIGLFAWRQLANGNNIYGGVSVPQLLQPSIEPTDSLNFIWGQHYYGLAGANFFLDDFSFIEPSIWVKYVPFAPFHADINIRWQWQRMLWVGGGFGTDGTLHFETGYLFRIKSKKRNKILKIGYGLDYAVNEIGVNYGSSHELNLTYSFGKR